MEFQQEEFKELSGNILGIGIDVEPISRFKNIFSMVNNGKLKKLFYPSEIERCKVSLYPERELAKIWCLKEATVKAFTGFEKVNILDIEMTNHSSISIIIHSMNKEFVEKNYKMHFSYSMTDCFMIVLVLVEKLSNKGRNILLILQKKYQKVCSII